MNKNLKVTEVKESEVQDALADATVEEAKKDDPTLEAADEDKDKEEDKAEDEKDVKESCAKKYKMKEEALESFKSIVSEQEGVPAEFASKLATMFEAIVNETVTLAIEEVESDNDKVISEEVAKQIEEVAVGTNKFLSLKLDEWVAENKVVLESQIKVEKAEKFLESLRTLASDNSLSLSEEDVKAVEEGEAKIKELEDKLNEQTEKMIELKAKLDEADRAKLFDELSVDLTETEKHRLSGLVENVKYADTAEYKQKVTELKESVFADKSTPIVEDSTVDIVKEGEGRPLGLMETLNTLYDK